MQFIKQTMMNRVLYALAPLVLFAIFLYGWRALFLVVITNIAALVTEYLFVRQRKGKVSMAVFVTGTILGLIVPPTLPYWMAVVGAVVAIAFGKMVFGGFGMNVFNPAIVGRTFIYVAFPNAMTGSWLKPFISFPGGFTHYADFAAITSATPIGLLKHAAADAPTVGNLFLGIIPGSVGETSALLIILAAFYLVFTKTAKWQPIVATLLGFIVFSLIFYPVRELFYYMFAGGIMFGAVFMATDPVSLPKTRKGIWIYGFLIGFLTVFIRRYSLFAEGFMFALLLANTVLPIIEYYLQPKK